MEARVEDFLSGMLDDCIHLMERWRRRHRPGQDWALARLSCWEGLARALPADLSGPNGPVLTLEPADYRMMWSEARALRLLQDAPPAAPADMPALVERLYGVLASRFDPPAPFAAEDGRQVIADWAGRHVSPPGLPQSAMALVDFVQEAPLAARNEQVAALLASVLPTWAGAAMVHVLPPDGRDEEGFTHALAAAREGEDGAWIAYYLARARRVLKRMPALLDGADLVRERWRHLLRRAPFEAEIAEKLAAELVALPVITPSFVTDTGIAVEHLRDALVLLFAADEAVEVDLPGQNQGFTVLPAALVLLKA